MRKFSEQYCKGTGTYFCSEKSVTAVVIKGLADHKRDLGYPLCPCRHYDHKPAEAEMGYWNCPCVPMRERHVRIHQLAMPLSPMVPQRACRHDLRQIVAAVDTVVPTCKRADSACDVSLHFNMINRDMLAGMSLHAFLDGRQRLCWQGSDNHHRGNQGSTVRPALKASLSRAAVAVLSAWSCVRGESSEEAQSGQCSHLGVRSRARVSRGVQIRMECCQVDTINDSRAPLPLCSGATLTS
jgi:hypothetical protein